MSDSKGKVIPPRAAALLMAAHQTAQAAQREFTAILETVRATLDVPADWQAQSQPDGTVHFVPPVQEGDA